MCAVTACWCYTSLDAEKTPRYPQWPFAVRTCEAMAGLIRGGVLDKLPWAFSGYEFCGWVGWGWMTFTPVSCGRDSTANVRDDYGAGRGRNSSFLMYGVQSYYARVRVVT